MTPGYAGLLGTFEGAVNGCPSTADLPTGAFDLDIYGIFSSDGASVELVSLSGHMGDYTQQLSIDLTAAEIMPVLTPVRGRRKLMQVADKHQIIFLPKSCFAL